MTIVESRAVPVLPTVTTTALERAAYHSVGLDERMKAGIGQFLTYDQIQERHATRLSQLIDRMRGLHVTIKDPKSFDYSVEGTRGGGSCVGYVVDGVPQVQLPPTVAHPGDGADNFMDPSEVGAIEVYSSSERPVEFGPGLEERTPMIPGAPLPNIDVGAQQCTLVVIWTTARLGLTDAPATPPPAASRAAPLDATIGRAVFGSDGRCAPPPPADTADVTVYGAIDGPAPRPTPDSIWAVYQNQLLQALARRAALPSELVLPVFGFPFTTEKSVALARVTRLPSAEAAPTLSAVIALDLDSAGQLTSAAVAASSLSGVADTALLAFVERAGAERALPRLPVPDLGAPSTRVYLLVASLPTAPAVPTAILGQLEVPCWRLSQVARDTAVRRDAAASRASGSGAAARIRVEMVVDAEGRPVARSTRIVGFDPPSAGTTVSSGDWLSALYPRRFEAARIGDCRVAELIETSMSAHER